MCYELIVFELYTNEKKAIMDRLRSNIYSIRSNKNICRNGIIRKNMTSIDRYENSPLSKILSFICTIPHRLLPAEPIIVYTDIAKTNVNIK